MRTGLASLRRKANCIARRFPRFSYPEVKKLLYDEIQPLLPTTRFRHFETLLAKARINSNQRLLNSIGVELMLIKHSNREKPPFEKLEYPTLHPSSHILKTGTTGSGKTKSSNIDVIRTALEYPETTQIVIDVEGDRGPDIISKLEENGYHDWWYFDHTSIRECMFELQRCSEIWFSWLARVFLEAAMFGDIGMKTILDGFEASNSPELMARRGGYPTYEEFVGDFSKMKARKGSKREGYNEVAHERFKMFLYSIGPLFNSRRSFPWEKLSGVVIYDLTAVPHDGQIFFQNYMATKMLFIRTFLTDDRAPIIYDLDEMSQFWSAADLSLRRGSIEMPIIIFLARRSRKRGIFISYKDQMRKTVPEEISSQCGAQFIFRHTGQSDLRQIGDELNLNTDQLRFIARMPDRQCVFILPGMIQPAVAEVPYLDTSSNMSLDEINEIMWAKLKIMEHEESGSQERVLLVDDEDGQSHDREEISESEKLADILNIVARYQGHPLSRAEQSSEMDYHEFWAGIEKLEQLGLIRKEKISLGFPGRPPWFAEITEKGAEFLGVPHETLKMQGKNKTLKAKVMCFMVAEKLKEGGCIPVMEFSGADIAVCDSGGRIECFEIETSANQHIAENIRRDICDIGAESCTVIMTSRNLVDKARKMCESGLESEVMQKTRFVTLRGFINP